MGNRVSIRFTNGSDNTAPVIFCHWGGTDFVEAAVKYSQELIDERKGRMMPLDRLEPSTVTVDFLYNIDKYYHVGHTDHRIDGDLYLGVDENDGDNGDNGHFNIDLKDVDKLNTLVSDIASSRWDGYN